MTSRASSRRLPGITPSGRRPGLASRCLSVFLLLAAGLHSLAQAPVIGLLLPPDEPYRDRLRRGALQALETFNATNSTPVRLIIRGRPGQWGDDGVEAGRLVLDDDARVLIAPPSGAASHLVLQVAGRTRTPVISLCADRSISGAGIPWMLRLVPTTVAEASLLLRPGGHWAALVPQGRTGREPAADLAASARNPSAIANLTPLIPVNETEPPHRELVHDLLRGKPEGIFVWLPSEPAARWTRALRDAGFSGRLAGPSHLRQPGFTQTAGPAAVGFRLATPRFPEPPASRDLEDPIASLAADAVQAAVEILRRAGPRDVHLVFPIGSLGTGRSGPLDFEANGDRRVSLQVEQWNGSRWEALDDKTP